MIDPRFSRRVLLACGFGLVAAPAFAQFGRVTQARLRIVKGGIEPDGTRVAGVHVALQPGWKTYWRHPGDSGIPPAFDWSRSDNLRSATVSYPAPERISDPGGDILGFRRDVVFPVRARPIDPARPVTLRLDMSLGLCEQICIPAELSAEIVHDGRANQADIGMISSWMVRVPRVAPNGTAVTAWRATGTGASRALDFGASLPLGVQHAVVEGPEGWQVPLPRRIATMADGSDHWRIERLRLGPDANPAREVRVTVVGRSGSIEESRLLEG
jgi:DsbC/DsbD-like thiol-disulfide interchange protein